MKNAVKFARSDAELENREWESWSVSHSRRKSWKVFKFHKILPEWGTLFRFSIHQEFEILKLELNLILVFVTNG
jgi:hypothetical protein